jgi:histidinol-phosphate aminotransferase
MQTMSKARGLASARIGFAFSNERVIELLNKVKPPYNVSGLNQQAAINALTEIDLFEKNIKRIRSQRKELEKNLLELESVVRVYPSQANFLLVEFDNADEIYETLINQKIIVRNRSKIVENCIRITVGTPVENDQLLNELKQIENEKSIVYRS